MKPNQIIICLLFLMYTGVQAQMSSLQIDDLANSALIKFNVVGAAVGIVKDGKIVHVKGYGYSSYNTKALVNEHTSFGIASNSKAFTAAALAILKDQGKLDWNDKVIDYIPEFRMYSPYVTENFTITDLLTHRSGIAEGSGDLMAYPDGADFTIEDVVTCFQYFKPRISFRTGFDYSNLLYWTAGEVVARVSGVSFDDFVEDNIFKPLSMYDSFGMFSENHKKQNMAMSHIIDNQYGMRQIEPNKDIINSAAGGFEASAYDMCQWMLAQLNHGKYGKGLTKTLFSESSQENMWRLHTVIDTKTNPHYNNHFFGYGLGWFVSDIAGKKSILHIGSSPGMLSKTWLIPELNLGIVVLTNTSDSGGSFYSAVSKTIMDVYLGLEKVDWIKHHYQSLLRRSENEESVTKKVEEQILNSKETKIDINSLEGVYEDPWFGKIKIHADDQQLWFKSYRSPKLEGPMFYYKGNTFVVKWKERSLHADAFVNFQLNEEGKPYKIKMKGISPNIDFSFDFQDLNLKKIADR